MAAGACQEHPQALTAVLSFTSGGDQKAAKVDDRTANSQPSGVFKPSEWVLPLIGVITFLVIAWQSFETRRAANATQKSVAVMEGQSRILRDSVAAAERAADAALLNARALIESERAWLLVRMVPAGPYLQPVASSSAREYAWGNGSRLTQEDIVGGKHLVPESIAYISQNYGRTSGWLTSLWCDAKIVPEINGLPKKPDYFTRPASIVIPKCDDLYAPGGDRTGRITIPWADLVPVSRRQSFLYVYGMFTYRDVWNKSHETGFCFYWHVPPAGDLDPKGWYQEGPEGYNYQT